MVDKNSPPMLASLELLRQLEDGEIVPPVKTKKVYSVCEIMKGHNKDLKERVRHIQALHDYWNERGINPCITAAHSGFA